MSVFSNRFREDLLQYGFNVFRDTNLRHKPMLRWAFLPIYKKGIMYKKAGVIVGDIVPISPCQADLFDPIRNRPQRTRLMKAMDEINHRYGLKTLRLAIEGDDKQRWKVKSEHRSPNYLTNINEILGVNM